MCFIQSPFGFENPQPLPNGFLALVLALCSSHSLRWPVFSAVVWWEVSMWYVLVPLLKFFFKGLLCLVCVSLFGSLLSISKFFLPPLPSLEHCVPSILSVWLPLFAIAHLFWICLSERISVFCLCILIIFCLACVWFPCALACRPVAFEQCCCLGFCPSSYGSRSPDFPHFLLLLPLLRPSGSMFVVVCLPFARRNWRMALPISFCGADQCAHQNKQSV